MSLVQDSFNKKAVENFREYLRIPSVHPNIDYSDCVKFLERQAKELELPLKVINVAPGKPVVVITWKGTQPDLPSILLNSHMDVVPVYEEKWTHKPFAAEIDDGKIYARGTQDMKSVGIQYLETVRLLKMKGVKLRRTFHITFVPDEEIGGTEGMKKFVQTEDFKKLNVGFAMDEGVTGKEEKYALFYAEKSSWDLQVHCPGNADHGSSVKRNHAGEKLARMLHKIYEFRDSEVTKYETNPEQLTQSDIISMNVTQVKGGVQVNVVPAEFSFTVDIRIPPTTNEADFENLLQQWCKEAGEGVWMEFVRKEPIVEPTKLDNSNPFWKALKASTDELGLVLKIMVCPGGTDMRYIRPLGVPALGFTPINHHEQRLHGHDEYIEVDTFLKGIQIYYKILYNIGNV